MKNNGVDVELNSNLLEKDIRSLSDQGTRLLEAKEVEREFILNLIKIRKEKNITQKELAERTGLKQQAISNIERMDRKPTLISLIRYLLGLGIDINDLIK